VSQGFPEIWARQASPVRLVSGLLPRSQNKMA
jgi:hypothetical protein